MRLTREVLAGEDTTIWPRPAASDAGMTSDSMTRHSIEYCGWLLTRGTCRSWASAAASRISSARHSETPMYNALPDRTTSAKASIVSSRGVS
jgi:hypothetical protein